MLQLRPAVILGMWSSGALVSDTWLGRDCDIKDKCLIPAESCCFWLGQALYLMVMADCLV